MTEQELMERFAREMAKKDETLSKIREALRDLVVKLDCVHLDKEYINVWKIAQNVTGGQYNGINYIKELSAARAAITCISPEVERG